MTVSVTLTLPYLVAGRELAAAAVRRLGAIAGVDVTVDARPLSNGTSSFAAQLVDSILIEGRAARLTLIGGPDDFADAVRAAVVSFEVTERFSFVEPVLAT